MLSPYMCLYQVAWPYGLAGSPFIKPHIGVSRFDLGEEASVTNLRYCDLHQATWYSFYLKVEVSM